MKAYKIIIFCIVITLVTAGCMQYEKPKDIAIGVAWPFATIDDLFDKGIDLAVNEINSNGGIKGRKLKLVKKDDGSNVEMGMAIAESFAENKEIQAVIGHANSFVSIPASAIYNNAGMVMLSPASTAPGLTRNGYESIFRDIPSDNEIARQLAIYLAGQGHRRMVIYYTDDSYGTGLANSFEDYAKSRGIAIVDRFDNYTGLDDLKHLHYKWQAYGFDGIFIAGDMSVVKQFMVDARQAGISEPFISGNALDSPQLAEIGMTAAEGTIVGTAFNPYQDRPEVKKFVDDFSKNYKEMPSSYAALGYDAVKMLADAIGKSDFGDRASVARELRAMENWQGVAGIHKFSANGDDIGDLVVLKKFLDGKFEYLDE